MSSPERCVITPISAFQSSNLSSKITSFDKLSDRILRSLGFPMINVEVHRDQLNDNISIACEMFTKFAGYTREYIIFNSNLYIPNYGLKLDTLFTAKSNDTYLAQLEQFSPSRNPNGSGNPLFNKYINNNTNVYTANSAIPGFYFTSLSALSADYQYGIFPNTVLSLSTYQAVISGTQNVVNLKPYFTQALRNNITQLGRAIEDPNPTFLNSFDYDIMDYRKVIAVVDMEEGSTSGINTLFTIEQTLAQQTYFSYAMGNYGFDLISWYVLKDWLKNREKLLATKPSWDFDDRTQIMRLYPQPQNSQGERIQYYGVLQCYVERPLRDVIKEQWVYQYALALTKIVLGRIRGKFTNTTLFGGGLVNADMLAEGLGEKEELERKLYEGTPGLGDNEPPMFFVG
jgi:hypothetical protein